MIQNVPVCWSTCFIRYKNPFHFYPNNFFWLFSFVSLAVDSKKSLFVQTCWQHLSCRKCHVMQENCVLRHKSNSKRGARCMLDLPKASSEDFIMAAFQLRWSRQMIRHERFSPHNSTAKLCKKKISVLLPAWLQSCVQNLNGCSTQLPKKFWINGDINLLLLSVLRQCSS